MMQSFKKKINSVIENGFDPISEGVLNFNTPKPEIEDLAKERLNKCLGCPLFVREPIPVFRVKDHNLNAASGKMCDDCGCVISYKIRQSKTVCKYWEK